MDFFSTSSKIIDRPSWEFPPPAQLLWQTRFLPRRHLILQLTASTVHDDSGANTSLAAAIDQETSSSDLQSPEPRKLPSITAVEATPEASSFSSSGSTNRQISSTSPKSSRTSSISLGKGTEVEASASSPVTITTSSDPQKTTALSAAEAPFTASSTSFASLENQENLTSAIDDLSSDSPTTRTSTEHVDSTVRDTTEQISGSELTHRDHDPSTHSHENLIVEELEISVDTKPTQSRPSSPYDLASPISDDRERTVSESDIHLSSTNDDPPTVRIDDAFSLSNKEEGEGEPNQSSSHSPIEETRPTDILSSIVVKEYPSFDSPTEPQPSPVPDSSQQSSHDSSLTDVEGQSQRPQSPTETIWSSDILERSSVRLFQKWRHSPLPISTVKSLMKIKILLWPPSCKVID